MVIGVLLEASDELRAGGVPFRIELALPCPLVIGTDWLTRGVVGELVECVASASS